MKVERSQLHFLAVTCTGEICKRSCNYCTCTQWNASTAYKLAISAAFFAGVLRLVTLVHPTAHSNDAADGDRNATNKTPAPSAPVSTPKPNASR